MVKIKKEINKYTNFTSNVVKKTEYVKRYRNIGIKKQSRKIKNNIKFYTGYKWEECLDALFIGSVMLIMLKLSYRIYFI